MHARRTLILLLLAAALGVAGCSAPKQRESTGGLVIADDFSTENNGWRVGVETSEGGKLRREIADGVYRVGITAVKAWAWWEWPSAPVLDNFGLQADFRRISAVYNESYGLFFCSTQAGAYYFVVAPSGEFKLYAWDDAAQEVQPIIDWTTHQSIKREGVNTLRVIRQEASIKLFANDELIAAVEDDRLPAGQAGLTFSLYEAGQELEVEVDNFKLGAVSAFP